MLSTWLHFLQKKILHLRDLIQIPFTLMGGLSLTPYGFGFRHGRACHILDGLENWLTEQCYGMKKYKPVWCFTFASGTSTAVEMLGQWVYCQVNRNSTQVKEKRDVDLKNFIVSLENSTYCLLSNYPRSNRIKVCEEFVQGVWWEKLLKILLAFESLHCIWWSHPCSKDSGVYLFLQTLVIFL